VAFSFYFSGDPMTAGKTVNFDDSNPKASEAGCRSYFVRHLPCKGTDFALDSYFYTSEAGYLNLS